MFGAIRPPRPGRRSPATRPHPDHRASRAHYIRDFTTRALKIQSGARTIPIRRHGPQRSTNSAVRQSKRGQSRPATSSPWPSAVRRTSPHQSTRHSIPPASARLATRGDHRPRRNHDGHRRFDLQGACRRQVLGRNWSHRADTPLTPGPALPRCRSRVSQRGRRRRHLTRNLVNVQTKPPAVATEP